LLAKAALTNAVTSQWSRPERGPGLLERPSGASEAGVDTHQVYRPCGDSTAEALAYSCARRGGLKPARTWSLNGGEPGPQDGGEAYPYPMNTAQAVAQFLRDLGVRRVFGVPGGELVELIEALRRRDVPFVLTHHEAPAAFMAAATGELSGVPGVCMATRGPGAVNLFAGVAAAYLDRRPLIAFTGAHSPAATKRDTHQNLPLLDLYRPVTRLAEQLTAENVSELLPKAAGRAAGPQPGPVFLPFPASEAAQDVETRRGEDGDAETIAALPRRRVSVSLPPAARDQLATSQRPLIMAGVGMAADTEAVTRLRALAEAWRCPVMVTQQIKGFFPEDHPLFAGVFGMYRDEPLRALMESADLILAVGLDGVDFFKRWECSTPVLSLAAEGAVDVTYQPVLAIEGSLSALLEAVTAARSPGSDWTAADAAAARKAIAEIVRPKLASAPDGTGDLMPPQAAIDDLRRLLPRDGICTVDVGSHKIVAIQQWQAYEPQTFICSGGLSPMGTGLPFAIAAKLERPEREVACICGDGGLLMYAGEMATVSRLGLKLTILLMADQALSSIKVKQVRMDYPSAGVEFARPDWGSLARGFGFRHVRVGRRSDCAEALHQALSGDQPSLVEASVDPEEYNTTQ
jgi:acetolactate synthase-1/2/3 large subunit